ncbi:MAG: hypothetical protein WC087_04045 [Candidatus Paceibacterota bacterium]
MTKEKIQEAIEIYRAKFKELGVGKADYPHEDPLDCSEHGLEHCHAMLDKMEKFLTEDRIEKVFRWLGFLQGVLWSHKIYTLDDLKGHNTNDSE